MISRLLFPAAYDCSPVFTRSTVGIPVAQTHVAQRHEPAAHVTGEEAMIPNDKKSNRPDEALARLVANGNAAAFDEI